MAEAGGDGDPKAFIKSKWIANQMTERAKEFTTLSDITVVSGTWNVNGKKPDPDENLLDWLHKPGSPPPDVFCIGFQEIVDLTTVNVVADGKTRAQSAVWCERLAAAINTIDPATTYKLVHEKHLVGIMLCVFAKEAHVPYMTRVQGQTAGVGVLGLMGNKGGVSIRFKFHDTTICCVSAHLAAHRDNVAGRNADFANILQRVQFVHEPPTAAEVDSLGEIAKLIDLEATASYGTEVNHLGQRVFRILDHDVVLFFGDFNYRIVEGVSTEEVFEKVVNKDLIWLRENDQLNVERAAGNVFMNFEEGFNGATPPFEPTYKFQPKTSLYERRPDKKFRAPAWCDRILWHAKDPKYVTQRSYDAAFSLEISDHKPVSAAFTVACKTVVVDQKREVYADVNRMLARWENDALPKVEVHGGDDVNFGAVKYMVEAQASVFISNPSTVIAHWRFTPKHLDTALCKRWLRVEPTFGMLIPGERAEIVLRAMVDNETAVALNTGLDAIDDVLVLHLEGGADYFVRASGTYARSCFGATLEELVCAHAPMREVPFATSAEGRRELLGSGQPTLSVPKELWRLVDAIYQRGLQERNLFLTQGNPVEVDRVRESLDTGSEFDPTCSVYSLADALWAFLNDLAEPVIPPSLFPTMEIDAQSIQPWSRRFLELLPPINYNVFVYMVSFFRELLLHTDANRLNSAKIAVVCCNCMVKTSPEDGEARELQGKHSLQLVINHLLTTGMI